MTRLHPPLTTADQPERASILSDQLGAPNTHRYPKAKAIVLYFESKQHLRRIHNWVQYSFEFPKKR
jgi:hypothetical protein